ncbi:hypothetical protein CLU96_2777 [Chryseobacterium sp. 52]|uniref:hypothetical protein n=1 Tax=Chryseobacterium sp. 52 TaxID=2035213 RepID=UPI000C19BB0A|nr:hypothetical protein [Chryseobacterium sp. 52]PIF45765.1 hypothetical protein CLU96_2777 [Chryseobacterium sp. 52]
MDAFIRNKYKDILLESLVYYTKPHERIRAVAGVFENTDKDFSTTNGVINLFYMTSLMGHEGSHWGNNIKGPGNVDILNKYKNNVGVPEHGRTFEFRMLQSMYPELDREED